MFLPTVLLSLTVAVGVLGQDAHEDCAVQAYVRAADLHQNEISHGELRVKLIGSACAPLTRVGLRLTLDEYAQSKPIRWDPESFEHNFAAGEHANITAAGAESISLQERGFSTGVTWNVHGQQLDSEEGFVRPFSVAMPNIQYPLGGAPVKFSHISDDQKSYLHFGRAYRYVVWILLEDGKSLGTPAGYTSFAIMPTSLDMATAEVVEMVQRVQCSTDCCDPHRVDPPQRASPGDKLPPAIIVKITFPQGNLIVPGQQLKVQLELLEPEPADSETHVDMFLGHWTRVLKSPPLLNDAKCSERYSEFNPLSTSNNMAYGSATGLVESKIQYGAPTVLTLDISPNSPIDAPGAFFTSEARIKMHIIRRHKISMNIPTLRRFGASSLVPEGYVQGGLSKISGRWAYDPDGMPETVAYSHDLQLPLVRPRSVGVPYSQAFESTEQPIMAPGHVQTRAEAEEAGAHFEFKLRETIDIPLELDSFIGQYVGVLWTANEKDLAAAQAASPINTAVMEQVIFNW